MLRTKVQDDRCSRTDGTRHLFHCRMRDALRRAGASKFCLGVWIGSFGQVSARCGTQLIANWENDWSSRE